MEFYPETSPLSEVENKALDKLAYYLARRDHSERELRDKLSRKFSPEVVKKALEAARERKWIIPAEVLAQRVAESLHRKRKGILYINRYLQKKGLPPVARDLDLELSKGLEWLKLKFRGSGEGEKLSFDEIRKAHRFLVNRGFDDETIKKATHEFKTDTF